MKFDEDLFGPRTLAYWNKLQKRPSFREANIIKRMEETTQWKKYSGAKM
jgi:hypothetical protein